jgi:cation:H+ antiporter
MSLLDLVLFVVGGGLLTVGAELLVRASSRLAATFGISPLVIGLTVVAFGTSAPELAVSLSSTVGGTPDVAVGNAVGSNIFNILIILGFSAAIAPLVVSQQLVRVEVPLMIGVSLLFWAFALDGTLGRLDGAILFSGVILYTWWAIRKSRREGREVREEYEAEFGKRDESPRTVIIDTAKLLAGLGLLVVGASLFVDGATAIASALGVSDLVIALTVVAAGTSMPELATSAMASIRGERDIAVGNAVGSNLFNILCVLGLTSLVDGAVPVADAALRFDIPVMTVVAVACLPIFFKATMTRWEGALFLVYWVAYAFYLILDAMDHEAIGLYGAVMFWFVLPLTAVVLTFVGIRGFVRRRRHISASTS